MLPDTAIRLLRDQYGVVARYQLTRSLPPAERRRVFEHPEIERLTARVYRHRVARPCREQELLAAVFDGGEGAALWGKSSASLWGFGRYRSGRPHVAVRRTRIRGARIGQMHKLRHLEADAVTTHLDLPVARPEETLLWMAGVHTHRLGANGFDLAVKRTGVTVDHAWRMGLVDGSRIHRVCWEGGGRGRSGIVVFRSVLEDRPPDYRPSGSALEDRFESTLPADLRAVIRRQVTVGGSCPIGTVDYRYRPAPLLIEINGEVFHSSLTDRAADEERYRRLVEAGFAVMVVWEYDVFHQPNRIVEALRRFARQPFRPGVIRPTQAPWEAW